MAAALSLIGSARDRYDEGSAEHESLGRILEFYGEEGVENGVAVTFGSVEGGSIGETSGGRSTGGDVIIKFDTDRLRGIVGSRNFGREFAGSVAHEGRHGIDRRNQEPRSASEYESYERRSFRDQADVYRGLRFGSSSELWDPGWPRGQAEANRDRRINELSAGARVDFCRRAGQAGLLVPGC